MDEQIRLECVDEDCSWIEVFSGLLLACSSGFEIYRRADDRIVLYDIEARTFYVLHDIDELGTYVPDAKCQQIKRALLDQSAWVATA